MKQKQQTSVEISASEYTLLKNKEERYEILNRVLFRLLRFFQKIESESEGKDAAGSPTRKCRTEYVFVPSQIDFIFSTLDILRKMFMSRNIPLYEIKFIDVGCGVGWIPAITQLYGFDSYGLEKHPFHKNTADSVMTDFFYSNSKNGKLILADMLLYKEYGKFNIIYFYVPIADQDLMKKFADHLVSQLKSDTVVIPNGFEGYFLKNKDFITDPTKTIFVYKPKKLKF